jgi:hypothetical protein
MLREKRFLEEGVNSQVGVARAYGWSDERLEVLCGLNAFYQTVLGPLASSARDRLGVLGRDIPIHYGDSLVFDDRRGARIRASHAAFLLALADVPAAQQVLVAPHFSDMVFALVRALDSNA